MSHEISFESGNAEVFTANTPAWHGLGVTVQGTQVWSKAMELAGLNWGVEKRQLEYAGKKVGAYGIFRNDTETFLGAVGNKYVPIQNKDMFKFMDAVVEADNAAHYESAGALGHGERIWALLRLPDTFSVKGDEHKVFLLGANPHDGGSMITKLTDVRVVCNNTYTAALGKDVDKELRIAHTASAGSRMQAATEALIGMRTEIHTLQEKLNFLATRRITPEGLTSVLTRLFPEIQTSIVQQNQAAQVLLNFESNDGDAFPEQRGTAYAMFNAFTRWVDHQRTARISTIRPTVDAARGENALFGSGEDFKHDMDAVLCEVSNSLPTITAKAGVRAGAKIAGLKVDSDIDAMLSEASNGK